MPNTSNRLVVFNDGEGADYTDLNRAMLWQDILANDYKFAMLTRTSWFQNAPWLETAYTKKLHRYPNAGYAYAGTTRQIKNKRGLIAKWIAAPDGTEPKLLCYFLDDDEISLTSAAADPTNPRYDVIAVKLEWENVAETRDFEDAVTRAVTSTSMTTYKRVKMTARIVQGTAAASPTVPAIAADEAYYCVYRIPATFNSTISLDPAGTNEFRDFTFPIGELKRLYVPGQQMQFNPADWTVGVTAGSNMMCITSSATGKVARAGIPIDFGRDFQVCDVLQNNGSSLSFDYGIAYSEFERIYSNIAASSKNFADFSSIDAHTCKFWHRDGIITSSPAQGIVKITTTGAQVVKSVEIIYK